MSIKNIPKGWTLNSFDDLLDYIQPTKYIVKSTEYDDRFKTPVLTAGKSFILGYTNEDSGIYNSLPVIIFDDFTTATKFVNFPFKVKSSAMKILAPKNSSAVIKFVFYFMQTLHANAGTHKRYWISEYSKKSIPLPPLPEQYLIVAKIEELFSEVDNAVENLRKAKEQLKVYRQAVLDSLVNGEANITIESVIEKLDQGWSPRCYNEPSRSFQEWGVIKTTAVQPGFFNEKENKRLPESLEPRKQHELRTGDILITRAGPRIRVGVCCLVKHIRPRLLNCDKVYRLRVKNELIIPEFLEQLLNSPTYTRVIETMKTGISDSGVNLTQKGFLKILISTPSIKRQHEIIQEIETRFSVANNLEQSIDQSLQQAEALRQSILKRAFEGRLVESL